jgi:Integrase core domain
VRPSKGTVGDAYDNAMAESFFATLECELIARRKWETKTQARLEIFGWIESWYNPRRRHCGLGQMSPINFENLHQEEKKTESNEQTPKTETPTPCPEDGLTTGCCAPVDKTPRVPVRGTSPCPQASPVDNPALKIINQEPVKIGV